MRLVLALALLTACGAVDPTPPLAAEAPPVVAPPVVAAPAETPEQAKAQISKINVNTATPAQLAEATGAGPKMVHEFEEYRPYASIQQFRKEIGKYVDEAKVASYEQHLYVPIAFNDCDAATLAQLPGVDDAEAATLVQGRPYATVDAFAEALKGLVTADELSVGRGWIIQP
ncbi:MAG: hypothetical protein AB8H79_24790 [Myxococcota bacterium]